MARRFGRNQRQAPIHREQYCRPEKELAAYVTASKNKLSYCWETARRESKTKIAELDVEMTNWLK